MRTIQNEAQRTELVQRLNTIFLFRYLTDSARDTLGQFVSFYETEPGETIVQEGDKSPYMYVVMDGSVNVFAGDETKEVFLCCLGAGEVFGEAGVFLKMKRTASVKAADEAIIMQLHRDAFVKFVRKKPRAANTVLLVIVHSLLRKLHGTNQELAFERKMDYEQSDIDAMIDGFLNNGDECE